ncbi:polyhydroxybutyrate depolymerase [Alteromonas sediminis]|uniref:Polyhydroxybutyrate depolymerase n=1 Tax=Alteromonas sediminis TaxID=2259342 RepID=A0A3N5Y329_9ALTE|nr:PHB depolymerase family esterase [Alteromonas sediminis]RPJ67126.1 polyhydroxybutyrate depolymerase [Alteromonas sediminis]
MKKTPFLSAALLLAASSANAEVPPLSLDTDHITVSGLSSGGYMATQMHLAYSDWVSGAGIIAAGPYYCAQNAITTALEQCVNKASDKLDISPLISHAQKLASEEKIAPLDNLKDSRVWLLRGTLDATIHETVADALHAQYAQWVSAENLVYLNDKPFGHHFPAVDTGTNCTQSAAPFIGNCNYDAAGALLNHLYTDLVKPDEQITGRIFEYNQQVVGGETADGLAEKGYLFVPKACEEGTECRVHVSFHGCNQYAEAVGQDFVTKTGLNAWADDNNIVVLYPQTKKSLFMPLNPQGCWDWWGYTGENYATRDAAQIMAIKTTVGNLAKPPL